ncbi:Protein of unknown function [Gryllus bimaculatus]|nr:Protein of unknown function [Gryllus bimaculatus]
MANHGRPGKSPAPDNAAIMSVLLRLNLVSLILIFLVIFVNAIESFLGDKITTSFSFTISSIRNSTGHRHVKCEINVPENKRRTLDIPNELLINVQQGAYFIRNRKHIQIVTSFSGKGTLRILRAMLKYSDEVSVSERLEAAGYAQWEVGEPSNVKTDIDSEQNCGEILRKNGKINDVSCRGKLAYFCEYE